MTIFQISTKFVSHIELYRKYENLSMEFSRHKKRVGINLIIPTLKNIFFIYNTTHKSVSYLNCDPKAPI